MNPSAPEHFDAIAERYAASEVHAQVERIRTENRARLAAASATQLTKLGIRVENGEYYIPVRTLIILGRNQ